MILADKARINKLPADLQKVIRDVSAEYTTQTVQAIIDDDASMFKIATEGGREAYSLSAAESVRWLKAIEPVIVKVAGDADSKGLPGTKAVEVARRVAAKYAGK